MLEAGGEIAGGGGGRGMVPMAGAMLGRGEGENLRQCWGGTFGGVGAVSALCRGCAVTVPGLCRGAELRGVQRAVPRERVGAVQLP